MSLGNKRHCNQWLEVKFLTFIRALKEQETNVQNMSLLPRVYWEVESVLGRKYDVSTLDEENLQEISKELREIVWANIALA